MLGEFFAARFFLQSISNTLYIRKKTKTELMQENINNNLKMQVKNF